MNSYIISFWDRFNVLNWNLWILSLNSYIIYPSLGWVQRPELELFLICLIKQLVQTGEFFKNSHFSIFLQELKLFSNPCLESQCDHLLAAMTIFMECGGMEPLICEFPQLMIVQSGGENDLIHLEDQTAWWGCGLKTVELSYCQAKTVIHILSSKKYQTVILLSCQPKTIVLLRSL